MRTKIFTWSSDWHVLCKIISRVYYSPSSSLGLRSMHGENKWKGNKKFVVEELTQTMKINTAKKNENKPFFIFTWQSHDTLIVCSAQPPKYLITSKDWLVHTTDSTLYRHIKQYIYGNGTFFRKGNNGLLVYSQNKLETLQSSSSQQAAALAA